MQNSEKDKSIRIVLTESEKEEFENFAKSQSIMATSLARFIILKVARRGSINF